MAIAELRPERNDFVGRFRPVRQPRNYQSDDTDRQRELKYPDQRFAQSGGYVDREPGNRNRSECFNCAAARWGGCSDYFHEELNCDGFGSFR